MAGMGPAPQAQKRRRNKETLTELPAEGYQGDFPALGKSYRLQRVEMVTDPKTRKKVPKVRSQTVPFLKATRDWYEAWARSPMATEFTGVHWQRLQRVARIVDQYERTTDPSLLAEIRLQEAGFGGTPLDLRRLGRSIGQTSPAAAAAPRATPRASSRRSRLSLVN